METWSQRTLSDLTARLGASADTSPPIDLRDFLAELDEPRWLRAMDPRDRAWLDAVEAPLHCWE